jgi:guanine nucleotide-binding protein alpha-1 subunit
MSKGRTGTIHSDSSSEDVQSINKRFSSAGNVAAPFTEKHRLLKMRLGPLRRIQKDLERRLGASTPELPSAMETNVHEQSSGMRSLQEFGVHSTNGWKTALDRFRPDRGHGPRGGSGSLKRGRNTEVGEINEVIFGCSQDIKAIWNDPILRSVLGKRKAQIEESPGLWVTFAFCISATLTNFTQLPQRCRSNCITELPADR